jgi:hypothetical protein
MVMVVPLRVAVLAVLVVLWVYLLHSLSQDLIVIVVVRIHLAVVVEDLAVVVEV